MVPTAPIIEPQATDMPVLVKSDVTRGTMEVRIPAVSDKQGEIR